MSQKEIDQVIDILSRADPVQVNIVQRYCEELRRKHKIFRGNLEQIGTGVLVDEAKRILGEDFEYFVRVGDIYVADNVVRLV